MRYTGFLPITKVDAAKREVYGVLAEEAVDKSKEIFDYDGSKPLFQKWNETFQNLTTNLDQPSLGNMREMHTKSAAGKFIRMDYDDVAKRITVVGKVVDDGAWTKVVEGVYTGFSIGGDYIKRFDDPTIKGVKRYVAAPTEGSLVDNPCMYGATFEMFKSDGGFAGLVKFVGSDDTRIASFISDPALAKALRKFLDQSEAGEVTKTGKTKTVNGHVLHSGDFGYVGSADDPSTWHFPMHDEAHVRAALSDYSKTTSVPASAKGKLARSIASKARSYGIDPKGFVSEHIKAEYPRALKKSMYDVGNLASALTTLAYLESGLRSERDWEEDDSEVPDDLKQVLRDLQGIFVRLAAEESAELLAEKTAQAELKKGVTHMVTFEQIEKGLVGVDITPELLKFGANMLVEKANHIASLAKGVAAMRDCHDSMGEHVDAISHHFGKADHALHKNVGALVAGHEKMDSHLDKVEGSVEKLNAAAEVDKDSHEKAAIVRALAKAERRHTSRIAELTSGFEGMLEKFVVSIEKMFTPAVPAAPAVPARTFVAPPKEGDGVPVGGLVTKGASAAATTIQIGDQQIAPVLANGMPNPAYVEKMTGNTSAFETKVKKAQMKVGNPFPENFGEAVNV